MKKVLFAALGLFLLASCSSVRVVSDYDPEVNFTQYKTYAFYKTGIDQAGISDLDKKRILRAIDKELSLRGFTKSTTPDFLVNITARAQERVNVYNNNNWGWGGGWGWGWGPGFWGGGLGGNSVTQTTEGVLYIDILDEKNKELVWQGIGKAPLREGPEAKTKRINEIVKKILDEFPPGYESN